MTLKKELRKILRESKKTQKGKVIANQLNLEKQQKIYSDYLTKRLKESARQGKSQESFYIKDTMYDSPEGYIHISDFLKFAKKNRIKIFLTNDFGHNCSPLYCSEIILKF